MEGKRFILSLLSVGIFGGISMKSSKKVHLLTTAAVLLGAQMYGGLAFAQDTIDDDAEAQQQEENRRLQAVEVIGQRIGAGLSQAGAVLGKDDIDRQVFGAEITSGLNRVPGVRTLTGDSRGGSFSFELTLRGLSDEQIGLTVDGIPTGDSRFNGGSPPTRFVESSNVGSIRVSQSTGQIGDPSRFALGGFIDFETQDPEEEFTVTAEAGYGSFDFFRGFSRIDTGEVLPGLTGYFSFSHRENDIFTGPISRGSVRQHFETKWVQQFNNGSNIKFRASYNDLEDNDFNIISLPEFEGDPDSDQAGDFLTGIPSIDQDFGGALGGNRADWFVYATSDFVVTDNLEFSVNPYVQTLRGESFRYQDSNLSTVSGDPREIVGTDALGGIIRDPIIVELSDPDVLGGPADLRITPRDRDRYGFTSEVRWNNVLEFNDFRTGIWYETSEATEDRNFFPIINPIQSLGIDETNLAFVEYERAADVDTFQFFFQDSIHLFDDKLRIDAGFTYLDISYDASSPLEFANEVSFSQDSGINPKVGLSYQATPSLEFFAGYSENFAGIPEDIFLGSTAIIDPNVIDPLESENADVGVRWVGGHAALALQGFYSDLKNNIGIVPFDDVIDPEAIIRGSANTQAANIGGQDSVGLELTGFYQYGDFNLYASYAYINARHDDPEDSTEIANLAAAGVIAGSRVRDIPEHSVFAELTWEPNDQLRVAANVNYIDDRVGAQLIAPGFCNPFFCFDENGDGVTGLQALGTQEIDGYALVGINARYNPELLPGISLNLNIDNLFNEDFISSVSGATATLPEFGVIGGQGTTLDRFFIGAPRTVTFSVRAKF